MPKTDDYGREILDAYEKGQLKSVATKAELAKFKTAARATAIKDRRVEQQRREAARAVHLLRRL